MTTHTVESLEARVMAFMTLELPGQPPMMHMGTSYLVQDLMAEVRRLSAQPAAEPDADDRNIFRRTEREGLVRMLVECYKTLSTLEGEDDTEAEKLEKLLTAIVRATAPHRADEADLLSVRMTPNVEVTCPPRAGHRSQDEHDQA